jgi:hypothetical protein
MKSSCNFSSAPDASDIAYNAALTMLHTGRGDPMATIEQALLADPGFVSGHCLRAALLVMACRDDARRELGRTLDAAQASIHRADERERRHLQAAGAWLANDLKRALNLYGEIVADHPRDTLALRVAHFGDLQWSRTERLRDRVAAVLPHWHEGIEGYTHVLGMYAFGLAEASDYRIAEQVGRRALELDRDNAGAIHAVAHVLEMQGRAEEGIASLGFIFPDSGSKKSGLPQPESVYNRSDPRWSGNERRKKPCESSCSF